MRLPRRHDDMMIFPRPSCCHRLRYTRKAAGGILDVLTTVVAYLRILEGDMLILRACSRVRGT